MNWGTMVDHYLAERRKLGYALKTDGPRLYDFATYATQQGTKLPLNIPIVLAWANQAPSGTESAIKQRIEIIRGFSRYLQRIDATSPIIPRHHIGKKRRRLPPYIYSHADVMACLEAAISLPPPYGIRPVTIYTYIGLLVATGLRPGEAVRLTTRDVDLTAGELTIHESKNWTRRMVPLEESTVDKLIYYQSIRALFAPLKNVDRFFLMDDGKGLSMRNASEAFNVIRRQVGFPRKANGHLPRLYDLRHTFVCNRVKSWYQSGLDVGPLITSLSRYLGHKKVGDTYWYITATPELMRMAAKRFTTYCHAGGER